MTRAVFSVVVIVTCAVTSTAQLLAYRSELKENGWQVPRFHELLLKESSEIKLPDGEVVHKKMYNAQVRRPSTLLATTRTPRGRITEIRRCEFSWLYAYSVKGRIFALDGSCGFVYYQYFRSRGELHTIEGSLGGVTRYTFYDEDGDGKFERRYNSNPADKNFNIIVPVWAKK